MSRSRIAAAIAAAMIVPLLLAVPSHATSARLAYADAYDPAHVLVTLDRNVTASQRSALHAALGTSVVNRFDRWNIDVVALPDGLDALTAVDRYRRDGRVADASLNKVLRSRSAPNDAAFSNQWGFHNTGRPVAGSFVTGVPDADIDAPEAWTAAFGAGAFESTGGTLVAVLDTGIDLGHVDLLNKVKYCAGSTNAVGIVVEGQCQDDMFHGTHTAGTVAANTNNTAGVAGTAPNAELAIFKFLNAAGVGFLADELAGLQWSIERGAKVFSMSYGSYEKDDAEEQAMKDAVAAGILPVAAAGNDGDDTKNYPAAYASVMSVAAHNAADTISDFSNCNADVEIAAPGEDIWSTFPGNSYGVISGTSMATPHVAGAAALVMSERGLTNTQTRNVLVNSAVPVASSGGRSQCNGYKRVNLAAAIGSGSTQPPEPPAPGAIAGRVTDQSNGAALQGATVSCGTAGSATTASDGTYSIGNVTPGSYTCTASRSGYRNKNQNVTVTSGQTSTANFALRPR